MVSAYPTPGKRSAPRVSSGPSVRQLPAGKKGSDGVTAPRSRPQTYPVKTTLRGQKRPTSGPPRKAHTTKRPSVPPPTGSSNKIRTTKLMASISSDSQTNDDKDFSITSGTIRRANGSENGTRHDIQSSASSNSQGAIGRAAKSANVLGSVSKEKNNGEHTQILDTSDLVELRDSKPKEASLDATRVDLLLPDF